MKEQMQMTTLTLMKTDVEICNLVQLPGFTGLYPIHLHHLMMLYLYLICFNIILKNKKNINGISYLRRIRTRKRREKVWKGLE